jgi:Fe-S-cluster containining protein
MPAELLTEESILREQPRLGSDDRFTFECRKGLDCFTQCCRDVVIVLTPYDVLRLRRALGVDSSEFLRLYTISPFTADQKFPAVLLKMDSIDSRCPFVTEDGCRVYANRPWACRMYPLGLAEPKNPTPDERRFHFLVREEICHGHEQGRECSVREWIENQGVEEYELHGASFKELMLDDSWDSGETLTPAQVGMFYMACYDLDRFRRFVFDSSFLKKFEVDEARAEVMRTDDEELLEFAMQWLRFALFKQRTMKIRR